MANLMPTFAQCYALVVSFYGCFILGFITAVKKMKDMMKMQQNMVVKEDTMEIVTITLIHILLKNNFHKEQTLMKIISNKTLSMKLKKTMDKNLGDRAGAKLNFDSMRIYKAKTDTLLYVIHSLIYFY